MISYARKKWQYSMYHQSKFLLTKHVLPHIGDMIIQKIGPETIEDLIDQLFITRVSTSKYKHLPESERPYLSTTTVREIYMLLKKCFEKAVEWEIITKSPVRCEAPKKAKGNRGIWDSETVKIALDDMASEQKWDMLHLAIHIAFICSSRNGETMGLTWDCINFEKNYIWFNKTLQRITLEAYEILPKNDIQLVFPQKTETSKSILVLKTPKTSSSDRICYMTKPLYDELLKRKIQFEKEKGFYSSSYKDYNLVFALPDGSPIEPNLIERWFRKWQKQTTLHLKEIDIHSIRHSSATYKLELSNGDIKSVQGDSGHSKGDILVNTYAHIRDENRAEMTNKVENDFYLNKNQKISSQEDAVGEIIKLLNKEPNMKKLLIHSLLAQNS